MLVFLAAAGIPELAKGELEGFFIALGTAGALLLVALVTKYSRLMMKYASLLTLCLVLAYNYLRLFFFSTAFSELSTGALYFRGYSFASLAIVLMIRFFEFKHKVIGLVGGFVLRFCIIGLCFDSSIWEADLIIRHITIDSFILFTFYWEERNERQVFRNFYQYRESFSKFKELITEYLPQSVTVINSQVTRPLFANKMFLENFEEFSRNSETTKLFISSEEDAKSLKLPIDTLEIDGTSVREFDSSRTYSNSASNESVNLLKVLENFAALDSSRCTGLTFSASESRGQKRFQVILKKIKWDEEEATAVIFTDITYQEKMVALKVADAQKGKILATISHELKTPLGAIFGLIDLCEKKASDPELADNVKLCKNNAMLLLSIVDSLVDLQQLDNGELKLFPSLIKLDDVLRSIMRLFSFQAKQNSIKLNLQIDKNVPEFIYTDQKKLEQILVNLLGNALKFTFEGSVTIEVAQCIEEDHIQISVIDTGVGIAEEDRDRLFNIYGKLEDKEAVNRYGVGLGLTVVKALSSALSNKRVKQAINVESKVGIGSKFSVKILKRLREEKATGEELEVLNGDTVNSRHPLINPKKMNPSGSALFGEYEELVPQSLETKITSYTFKSRGLTTILNQENGLGKHQHLPLLKIKTEFSIPKNKPYLSDAQPLTQQTSLDSSDSSLGANHLSPKKAVLSAQLPRFQSEHILSTDQILVVDDNPFNLLVAENQLKGAGYSVKVARSGPEAIKIMKSAFRERKVFKAILMDCQMPIMDGFETTGILKEMMKNNEIQKVTIIALTANTSQRDVERCFESGMDDFLAKPLLIDKLKKSLSMIAPSN